MRDELFITPSIMREGAEPRDAELDISLPPTRTVLPTGKTATLVQSSAMAVATATLDPAGDQIVIILAADIIGGDQFGLQHVLSPAEARAAAEILIASADEVEGKLKTS